MPNVGDELYKSGWSACMTCRGDTPKHKYLVLTSILTGNIYVIDVLSNPKSP